MPKFQLLQILLAFYRVNAGFGTGDSSFGVNGGFQVGNPLNNNLLFPVIVGLGLLSLFNIVLTVITPLLSGNSSDDSDDTAAEKSDHTNARSMRAMDVINMANTVYEAINKYSEQQQ